MASQNFKDYITKFGKEIYFKLVYTENEQEVTIDGDSIINVTKTLNSSFMSSVMQYLTITLDGKQDYTGETFKAYLGVSYEGGDIEWQYLGQYLAQKDELKYTYSSDQTSFTAYDYMIKAHTKFDVTAQDYTCISLFDAICNNLEIGKIYDSSELINASETISQSAIESLLNDENSTYRDVLDYLAQVMCCNIIANDNSYEIKYHNESSVITVTEDNQKNIQINDKIGIFNKFTYTEISADEEGNEQKTIHTYQDDTSIEINGVYAIDYTSNPFITDSILSGIYNYLNGYYYYAYVIDSFGYGYFEPLQTILIDYNGLTYRSVILNDILSVNNGLSESFNVEITNTSNDYSSMSYSDKQLAILDGAYKKLNLESLKVRDIEAENGSFNYLKTEKLKSAYAEIDLANIKDLTGEKLEYALANIDTLNSQTAFIKDLTSDTISSGISESIVSNVENGYTQNAVAKLLLAQALMSDYAEIGVIKSKDIVVGDTDGNTLELLGATQILKDSDGNIRVVLGKHNDTDYNLSIYDADGNELFNADGVTYDGALKSDIVNVINNDGYSDKIDVTRLNISSLINVLNGEDYLTDANGNKLYVYKDSSGNITYDSSKAVKDSDGNPKKYYIFRNRITESLKASAILYDATEQTLDVLFSNYVVGENSVLQSSYQLHNGLLDFLISNVSSTALTEKPYDWDYAYYKYYYYDSTDKTYKHISSAVEWETGKYYSQNTDYSQIKMTDDAINLISNNVNVYADKIKFDVDHEFNVNDNFIVDKDGNVTAKSGTFGGTVSGGSININNKFKVDSTGKLTATSGNFSGDITGATGTFYGSLTARGNLNIETHVSDDYTNSNYFRIYTTDVNGIKWVEMIRYRDSTHYEGITYNGIGGVELATRYRTDSGWFPASYFGANADGTSAIGGTLYINGYPYSGSDEELKQDITDIPETHLELLHKLRPVSYRYKPIIVGTKEEWNSAWRTGFIAQEVENSYKELEIEEEQNVIFPGNMGGKYYGLDYGGMTAILWKIVQKKDEELQDVKSTVQSLQSENESLKSKVEDLEARLLKLESLIK